MFIIDSVSKKYGEKQVLYDISFSLSPGRIVGLLGPNGAGKTTLLKIMCNLVTATQGSTSIDGRAVKMKDFGLVFEGVRHFYWPLSVKENYYYLSALKGISRKAVQCFMKNDQRFQDVNQYWETPFGELSFGQKQMVATLQALIPAPRILCLDEPSNGLDINHVGALSRILQSSSKDMMILVSSHDIGFLHSLVDSFIVLNKGHVIQSIVNKNVGYEEVYSAYTACLETVLI